MTLHQLRIFFTVAQASTLTRASKQLGLAQPSLSKQLAGLEESIGTRLFDRGHNRMELTDAGRLLLHHAQNVLKEIDDLSYADIAKRVGCSIGTVMSRLFYARQKLQPLLQDLHEEL